MSRGVVTAITIIPNLTALIVAQVLDALNSLLICNGKFQHLPFAVPILRVWFALIVMEPVAGDTWIQESRLQFSLAALRSRLMFTARLFIIIHMRPTGQLLEVWSSQWLNLFSRPPIQH
jgi:type III secretory pathway component EscS